MVTFSTTMFRSYSFKMSLSHLQAKKVWELTVVPEMSAFIKKLVCAGSPRVKDKHFMFHMTINDT
jgi:hypothetical protein